MAAKYNEAQALSRQGKHKEALPIFKIALQKKINGHGADSMGAALSYNALGECYLALEEYALARENLLAAHVTRQRLDPNDWYARSTRNNLSFVCEETGDLKGARQCIV